MYLQESYVKCVMSLTAYFIAYFFIFSYIDDVLKASSTKIHHVQNLCSNIQNLVMYRHGIKTKNTINRNAFLPIKETVDVIDVCSSTLTFCRTINNPYFSFMCRINLLCTWMIITHNSCSFQC